LNSNYTALLNILKSFESAVVAFSGGIDSTLLSVAAREALGSSMLAVTVATSLQPPQEIDDAAALAHALNIPHRMHKVAVLDDPEIRFNRPDRCYRCKSRILKELLEIAAQEGYKVVMEGSNPDDLRDYRPGMKAVKELGVRSPLLEAALDKAQIREIARNLNLPNSELPSAACLASRLPYNEEITLERLARIDRSERFLKAMGLTQVRVRDSGNMARIEVLPREFEKILADSNRRKILAMFKSLGYSFVSLDLEGYRMGSWNENKRKE
jgi:pyridinium-3,5-biscarboxylic acid mononucleotide sulfurtransferase